MQNNKFDFDDILIKPFEITNINSRKEVSVIENFTLPLITAPMDSLFSYEKKSFNKLFNTNLTWNGINKCYPRIQGGSDYNVHEIGGLLFGNCISSLTSCSLADFITFLNNYNNHLNPDFEYYLLIDIANGHMDSLYNAVIDSKFKYPNLKLMVGNVANPTTYKLLSEIGVDYIRIGIGNGAGCLTTQQLGVGYPMASLIQECYEISKTCSSPAKIVADGGFKKYSDIIKAIALGADYVMIGSILNKTLESDSYPYLWKIFKIKNLKTAEWLFKNGFSLYKSYRGMSTKAVQKIWGNKSLKTSEGITKWNKVEYTLEGWTNNFKDYLKSAMSYTNCRRLEEFRGNVEIIHITENSLRRYSK